MSRTIFLVNRYKMEFIQLETKEQNDDNQQLGFSDNQEEITNDEIEDFIVNMSQLSEDINLYHSFDSENIRNYFKFQNQTRHPILVVHENNISYYGKEDTQTEYLHQLIEMELSSMNLMSVIN